MQYTIHVTHGGRSFHAGVASDEKVDQLLLRSLDYFDIDPTHKGDWALARSAVADPEEARLVLDRPVADQLRNGDRVELRARDMDAREPATGSY